LPRGASARLTGNKEQLDCRTAKMTEMMTIPLMTQMTQKREFDAYGLNQARPKRETGSEMRAMLTFEKAPLQ
jgi:hypothetical protein